MVKMDLLHKAHTKYRSFVAKLFEMPLWVKQAVYVELRQNISVESDIDYIDKLQEHIIQLYVPELSCDAKRLMTNLSKFNSLHMNQRKFLNDANEGLSLIEIAQSNNWSLKECSIFLLELLNDGYVEPFKDPFTHSFVLFLTGKIRIGEFLFRMQKISYEQLDKAICAQKYASDFDSEMKFTEVLVNLGYTNHAEIEKIYNIRESADKKVSLVSDLYEKCDEINSLQDSLDAAVYEKIKLEKHIDDLNKKNREMSEELERYKKSFLVKMFAPKK